MTWITKVDFFREDQGYMLGKLFSMSFVLLVNLLSSVAHSSVKLTAKPVVIDTSYEESQWQNQKIEYT